ncbi:MAG: hypothetical protein ACRCZN_13725 [Lactococcus lactis]
MNKKTNKNHKRSQILGKCYKDLRLAKSFTQTEAAGEDISVSQLSNFEHGNSTLTTIAFLEILQNINVTDNEIHNIFNNRLFNEKDNMLFNEKIAKSYLEKNPYMLKRLLCDIEYSISQFPRKKKYKLDKIKIQTLIANFDSSYKVLKVDIDFVKNYLLDLNEWGEYEITLLDTCASIFDIGTLSKLTNQMLSPTSYNYALNCTSHLIVKTLNDIIGIFIKHNQYSLSQKFIDYLEHNGIEEYYMYDKTIFKYNKAKLSYKQGNENEFEIMKKCQHILEFIGCYETAKKIYDELKDY